MAPRPARRDVLWAVVAGSRTGTYRSRTVACDRKAILYHIRYEQNLLALRLCVLSSSGGSVNHTSAAPQHIKH